MSTKFPLSKGGFRGLSGNGDDKKHNPLTPFTETVEKVKKSRCHARMFLAGIHENNGLWTPDKSIRE